MQAQQGVNVNSKIQPNPLSKTMFRNLFTAVLLVSFALTSMSFTEKENPGPVSKKNVQLNLPGNNLKFLADRNTILSFLSESRERAMWSVSLKSATQKADAQIMQSFKLRNIMPAFTSAQASDNAVLNQFYSAQISNMQFTTAKMLVNADKAMDNQFLDQNFSIATKNMLSFEAADKAILNAFVHNNTLHNIVMPGVEMVQKADAEILNNHTTALPTATLVK